MKKLLLIFIMILSISLLAGCDPYNPNENLNDAEWDDYFVLITKWDTLEHYWQIVYAKDTKVKYIIIDNEGMCPLYNADGTLQIYTGVEPVYEEISGKKGDTIYNIDNIENVENLTINTD